MYNNYMSKLDIRSNIKKYPITKVNKKITEGSIVIQFGCENITKYNNESTRTRTKIFLQLKDYNYKEYSEDALQQIATTIQLVTGFILGPMTVVELYEDPFLHDLVEVIINDTTDYVAVYVQECTSDELQIDHTFRKKGEYIRSICLWNYEYYVNNRMTRYCETDFDCGLSEYCLCPNGAYNGNYCPEQKKRCLPKAEYSDEYDKINEKGDVVNIPCMDNYINEHKKMTSDKHITFGDIDRISSYCSKKELIDLNPQKLSLRYYYRVDNVKPKFNQDGYRISTIENFSKVNNKYYINIVLMVSMVVLFIIIIKKYFIK